MRRKRRTKYYWLPTYGTPNKAVDPTTFSTSQQLQLSVPLDPTGPMVTGWTPIVVNDVPNDVSEENFPLNDIIGNEYIVKRIVGKCPVDVQYFTEVDTIPIIDLPPVVVGAGFYVARADRVANNFNPVDSAAADTLYNPLNSSLQREPWAWRRTWLLGPGAFSTPGYVASGSTINNPVASLGLTIGGPATYPTTNVQYGSVLDGPHIDAKTGRRVRQDENLFFGFAAHFYPYAVVRSDLIVTVNLHLDVRVLGALRRARNRSNF